FILVTGRMPDHNLFSWTNPTYPIVCYQWLYQVVVARLFQIGGLTLIGSIVSLASGLLVLYLLPVIWVRQGIPLAVAYWVLTWGSLVQFFQTRPQHLSNFLIVIFILLLESYRQSGRRKLLVPLPMLMLIWVNWHSFFSLGLLSIAVYCLVAGASRKTSPGRLPPLLLTLGASLLAVLINPYGMKLIPYLWTFVDGRQFLAVMECRPSYLVPSGILKLIYLAVCWLVLIKYRQHVRSEGFVLSLISTIAAIFVARYLSVAVLMTWVYTGRALAGGIAW